MHADGSELVDRRREPLSAFPVLGCRPLNASPQKAKRGGIAGAYIDEAAKCGHVVANASIDVGLTAAEVAARREQSIVATHVQVERGRGTSGFEGIEHVSENSRLVLTEGRLEGGVCLNGRGIAFEQNVDGLAPEIESRTHAAGDPFLQVEARTDGHVHPFRCQAKPAGDVFFGAVGVREMHDLRFTQGTFDEVFRGRGVRRDQLVEGRSRRSIEDGDPVRAVEKRAVFQGLVLDVAIGVLRGRAPEFRGLEAVTPCGGFVGGPITRKWLEHWGDSPTSLSLLLQRSAPAHECGHRYDHRGECGPEFHVALLFLR